MRFLQLVLLFACITVLNVHAQDQGKVVATAGHIVITTEEFADRFDFMPRLHFSDVDQDSLKKEFLLSLIAEKLWAIRAEELGYDTLHTVRLSINAMEVLMLKDALYRDQVLPLVVITEEELREALQYVPLTLTVGVIASKDLGEISNYYERLLNGEDFAAIQMERKAHGVSGESIRVTFGALPDENLEHQLFQLNPSAISKPIQSEDAFYIFKVFEIETDSLVQGNTERLRNIAYARLRERREKLAAGRVLDSLLGGTTVRMNEGAIDTLASVLYNYVISDSTAIFPYQTKPAQLASLLQQLSDSFRQRIIAGSKDEVFPVEAFLYSLFSHNISIAERSQQSVKVSLLSHVKGFLEDRILAQKAIGYNLNQNSDYHASIGVWKQHYLSDLLMQTKMQEAINSGDEQNQDETGALTMVNIQEILAQSPQIIDTIFQQLDAGVPFAHLARKYNTRPTTLKTGGVWGFFNPGNAGEIGRVAAKLNIGDMYGPIITEDGLSLFVVLEKKEVVSQGSDSALITLQGFYNRIDTMLNRGTSELAKEYGVTIDENVLKNVEVSPLRTFTYRLIGFGGRIAAQPFTTPLYQWYQEYIQDYPQP